MNIKGKVGGGRLSAVLFVMAPLAIALGGCGEEPGAGESAGAPSQVTVERSGLSTIGGGTWEYNVNGTNGVWLAPSFRTTCFLTSVGGRFAGTGEWVQVSIESGSWVLRGSTGQGTDLFATASCIGVERSSSGTWTSSGARFPAPRVKLQHGGSCFATVVQGQFISTSDSLLTSQDSNGDWWVGGASSQIGNRITATCINDPSITQLSTTTTWAAAPWSTRLIGDPSRIRLCYLQGIRGPFFSPNESVTLTHGPTSYYWYMSGASSVGNIGSTAGCLEGP